MFFTLREPCKKNHVTYFHYVLEAKLVTSTGLSISLASEFIENDPGRDYEKQDCEQKAFVRLAAKIKKHFPRLPVCILGDGLYPNNTVRTTLEYEYLNEIEYDRRYFSWVECNETVVNIIDKTTKIQRFTYITNVTQNGQNIVRTADSGRLRWKIENEGFNSQKNLGYELEHKFSRVSFIAMQNYYQLLQIAHIINQLVERSKQVVALLTEHSKQTG